jgi:hypothetical protein
MAIVSLNSFSTSLFAASALPLEITALEVAPVPQPIDLDPVCVLPETSINTISSPVSEARKPAWLEWLKTNSHAKPSIEREELDRLRAQLIEAGGRFVLEGEGLSLTDLFCRLKSGEQIIEGAVNLVFRSELWGTIDLRKLHDFKNNYQGRSGQVEFLLHMAVVTGRLGLSSQILRRNVGKKAFDEKGWIMIRIGWRLTRELQQWIDWDTYKGRDGYDLFALDFFDGNSKKAYKAVTAFLDHEDFNNLQWGPIKGTNVKDQKRYLPFLRSREFLGPSGLERFANKFFDGDQKRARRLAKDALSEEDFLLLGWLNSRKSLTSNDSGPSELAPQNLQSIPRLSNIPIIPSRERRELRLEWLKKHSNLKSKVRRAVEERELIHLHAQWREAGGIVCKGVSLDIPALIGRLQRGEPIVEGGENYLLCSELWGIIDLNDLNDFNNYQGPSGQVKLYLHLAIITGQLFLDLFSFIGKIQDLKRIFYEKQWIESSIKWRLIRPLSCMVDWSLYSGDQGQDQFAIDFSQGYTKRAWRIARVILDEEKFGALGWKWKRIDANRREDHRQLLLSGKFDQPSGLERFAEKIIGGRSKKHEARVTAKGLLSPAEYQALGWLSRNITEPREKTCYPALELQALEPVNSPCDTDRITDPILDDERRRTCLNWLKANHNVRSRTRKPTELSELKRLHFQWRDAGGTLVRDIELSPKMKKLQIIDAIFHRLQSGKPIVVGAQNLIFRSELWGIINLNELNDLKKNYQGPVGQVKFYLHLAVAIGYLDISPQNLRKRFNAFYSRNNWKLIRIDWPFAQELLYWANWSNYEEGDGLHHFSFAFCNGNRHRARIIARAILTKRDYQNLRWTRNPLIISFDPEDIDFPEQQTDMVEKYYAELIANIDLYYGQFRNYITRLGGENEYINTLYEAFIHVVCQRLKNPEIDAAEVIHAFIRNKVRHTYKEVSLVARNRHGEPYNLLDAGLGAT